jgi:hypothetical protein
MDFKVPGSGEKNVKITFSNGAVTSRPISISVNDSVVSNSLNFRTTGAWTKWDTNNIVLKLDKGVNTIRFTSLNSDGGPDIDKVEIGSPVSAIPAPHQMVNHKITFNPVNHTIQARSPGKIVRVELYRINGLKVFGKNLFSGSGMTRLKLPVNKLEDGRYYLKMSAGGSSEIQSFDLIR